MTKVENKKFSAKTKIGDTLDPLAKCVMFNLPQAIYQKKDYFTNTGNGICRALHSSFKQLFELTINYFNIYYNKRK